MKKNLILSGLLSLLITGTLLGIYAWFQNSKTIRIEHVDRTPAAKAVYTLDENGPAQINAPGRAG
ncbi:MAG: hypothetical protein L6Q97_27015 [Thermoanaerobaculia bacterium]|nr:hypothetical protein [Thermoanaerobaculia bacterium]